MGGERGLQPGALPAPRRIGRDGLQALIDLLRGQGFEVIAPVPREGAIVYAPVQDVQQLPEGWGDEQQPGHYRLRRRDDLALFGYAVGPQSWKKYLYPPVQTLWTARWGAEGLEFEQQQRSPTRYAFIGVRACEIQAIAVQDRVFAAREFADPDYAARRRDCLIVAVHCAAPSASCFCTSMGSGPRAQSGFDLALTELSDASQQSFVVEAGSAAGRELLAQLPGTTADAATCERARQILEDSARSIERRMPTAGIKELLQHNPHHPRWDDVAERCLSCANCTNVCPTCFCSTIDDSSDLSGLTAQRTRKWDSCFTLQFSELHGGSVRHTTRARYRQWLTHKLANWIDQFGVSGCVGCGRCITWCPVGIDLTAEVAAIRATGAEPGIELENGRA